MSRHVRPKIEGAKVFFTVALANRGSDLLVREVDALRGAVRATRAERPFRVEAWVVMPDHIHAVWTLPEGDGDCAVRWGAIKSRFTMALRRTAEMDIRRPGFSPAPLPTEFPMVRSGEFAGLKPGLRVGKREQAIWQRRFWGEERPEIGPVDRFQRRTGEAPAAKPITSATRPTS